MLCRRQTLHMACLALVVWLTGCASIAIEPAPPTTLRERPHIQRIASEQPEDVPTPQPVPTPSDFESPSAPPSLCDDVDAWFERRHARMWHTLGRDHTHYWGRENLLDTATVLGVGAALANTNADEYLQDRYRDKWRSGFTDAFGDAVKPFGEGQYVVAATFAATALAWSAPESEFGPEAGRWSDRNVRALLVGTPLLLFLQVGTGASRPVEERGSRWRPFEDSNGVSGHAYIAAVPFINAAMMTDDPLLKASLYAGSTLTALSRINDDSHFVSQSLIGWWLAYAACRSVNDTERDDRRYELVPLRLPEATGIGCVWRY